jgi:hypothetical protein
MLQRGRRSDGLAELFLATAAAAATTTRANKRRSRGNMEHHASACPCVVCHEYRRVSATPLRAPHEEALPQLIAHEREQISRCDLRHLSAGVMMFNKSAVRQAD